MTTTTFTLNAKTFEVVQAEPADADPILALLVSAARWIAEQGNQQWAHYRENPAAQAEALAGAIGQGEVFLARHEGRLAATISLLPAQGDWDRVLWGEDGGEALYVHRLAIDRAFAGVGLGAWLLAWAEGEARTAGKRYLRLDCVAENPSLNAYYSKRYDFMGQSAGRGSTFSMYQKRL